MKLLSDRAVPGFDALLPAPLYPIGQDGLYEELPPLALIRGIYGHQRHVVDLVAFTIGAADIAGQSGGGLQVRGIQMAASRCCSPA